MIILTESDDKNAWKYYFEQPENINLKDIRHSKNIILRDGGWVKGFPGVEILTNLDAEIARWKPLYDQYIRENDETELYIQKNYQEPIGDKRVLGILCRGTDYLRLKPKDHPIQPDIQTIIDKAKEMCEKGKYTHVYLATEDKEILSHFREVFDKTLLFPNLSLREYTGNFITEIQVKREHDKLLKGREYLM